MTVSKSGLGFIPATGYVALALPENPYPDKDIVLNQAAVDAKVEEAIAKATSEKLKVAALGVKAPNVDRFVELGDMVLLSGLIRAQKVLVDSEIESQPTVYLLVREVDIICKFD